MHWKIGFLKIYELFFIGYEIVFSIAKLTLLIFVTVKQK